MKNSWKPQKCFFPVTICGSAAHKTYQWLQCFVPLLWLTLFSKTSRYISSKVQLKYTLTLIQFCRLIPWNRRTLCFGEVGLNVICTDLYKSIQTLKSIQIWFPNFELSWLESLHKNGIQELSWITYLLVRDELSYLWAQRARIESDLNHHLHKRISKN